MSLLLDTGILLRGFDKKSPYRYSAADSDVTGERPARRRNRPKHRRILERLNTTQGVQRLRIITRRRRQARAAH